ncbi:carboxymuconolactone decarboxylase family protein (plasmid) [Coraliomargarita sp. W4R53]
MPFVATVRSAYDERNEDAVTPTYLDRLSEIAVGNSNNASTRAFGAADVSRLDPRSLALARLAALIAVGGAEPSFGEHTDAAVSAGVSPDEMVDLLLGVSDVVGVPRVVEAAPKLALALGYDLDDL